MTMSVLFLIWSGLAAIVIFTSDMFPNDTTVKRMTVSWLFISVKATVPV